MTAGHFLTGFAQAFGQGIQGNADKQAKAKERKLQAKLLEARLEVLDRQADQQTAATELFQPNSAPTEGVEGPPTPGTESISARLAAGDPTIQQLLSRAGVGPGKILELGAGQREEQRSEAFIQSLPGLLGRGKDGGASSGTTPRLQPSGVSISATGKPSLQLKPPRRSVQKVLINGQLMLQEFVETPDGLQPGQVLGQAEASKLDEPFTPAELQLLVDENGESPSLGTTPRQLQSGGFKVREKKTVTAQEAGKLAALEEGASAVQTATFAIFPNFDPSTNTFGEPDSSTVLEAAMPFGGFGEGRRYRAEIGKAVSAKVRAETGAGMRPDEKSDVEARFVVSPLDLSTPGLAEQKTRSLKDFLESALDIAALPPRLQKALKARRAEEKKQTARPKAAKPEEGLSVADIANATAEDIAEFDLGEFTLEMFDALDKRFEALGVK